MQRDREHGADFVAGADDVGHHARGRQRDPPLGNAEPVAVGDHAERVAHRLEIVERLAHAHHDDIGDEPLLGLGTGRRRRPLPIVEPVARQDDLADDLARREIAHQALRAGMAERATERAADLAGNAQRAAIGLRDIDAFDVVRPIRQFAREPQQPFARAVDRDLLGGDLRPRQREMLRQLGAEFLRQGRHGVEAFDAPHVQPMPNLLHPHAALPLRHTGNSERIRKRDTRQSDQRRFGRRHIALERPLFDGGGGRDVVRLGSAQRDCHGQSEKQTPLAGIDNSCRRKGRGFIAGYLHSWSERSMASARPLREKTSVERVPLAEVPLSTALWPARIAAIRLASSAEFLIQAPSCWV